MKFCLRTLLVLTAAVAMLLAGYAWIRDSDSATLTFLRGKQPVLHDCYSFSVPFGQYKTSIEGELLRKGFEVVDEGDIGYIVWDSGQCIMYARDSEYVSLFENMKIEIRRPSRFPDAPDYCEPNEIYEEGWVSIRTSPGLVR